MSVFARPLQYHDKKYILPVTAPLSALLSNEQFVFTFERMDADANFGYKTFAQGIGPTTATVRLIPGTYEVRGNLILNETITIGAEQKTFDGGIFGESKTVRLNATVIDQWQEGGVILNEVTGLFEVPQDKLFNSNKLNMYVLRFPRPTTHSTQFKNEPSLEQAGELEQYSNVYRTELEPEWIT
jgi:hypothetical protein